MSILQGSLQIWYQVAADWTSEDPTLLAGQEGHESDTGFRKIGDGTTPWTSLPYLFSGSTVTTEEGIVAHAGGGQSLATGLSAAYNFIDTVATLNDSVKILVATVGLFQYIQNNGANSVNVYPFLGDNFIGAGVNAPIAISAGGQLTIVCATAGTLRYF